jgi:hypothetical protein
MKQIIKNYSFDKTARTVTLSDFSGLSLDRLLLITNVSRGAVVYQFNDPALGGSVAGNTVTLSTDTSAMSNGDKLQIIYDCASGDPVYDASAQTAVQGNAASGSTDAGNPLKVGGVYHTAPPTFTNGQRGDLQIDSQGRLLVNTAPLVASSDSVSVQGSSVEFSGLSASSATDLLPSTDVLIYKSLSLHVTGTVTATLAVQGSNDNTNWVTTSIVDATNNVNATLLSSNLSGAVNKMFYGLISFRYLRVRLTSYTSGTANATVELYTSILPPHSVGVIASQNGTWTVTANVGTTNGLALDATLTGGTAKSVVRGGAKGASTAADVTSTAAGANHQLLDVALYDALGNQITSLGGSSTGVAVPSSAFFMGVQAATGNLTGIKAFDAGDGLSGATIIGGGQYAWDGAAATRLRTPSIFKTASATAAGNTAVWTPAAGKRFRLMRYRIEVTGNAAQATAGTVTIQFQDNTTNMAAAHSVFVPQTAGTVMGADWNSGWIDLGNGIISTAANNVLNINLSSTLTPSGIVRVIACGTEE